MYLCGLGMLTAVGSTALATYAGLRARVSPFAETFYRDIRSEPIIGAAITVVSSRRKGFERWLDLAVPALLECWTAAGQPEPTRTRLLLGVPDDDRRNPYGVTANDILRRLVHDMGIAFSDDSRVVGSGSSIGISALALAREELSQDKTECCIVGGVDSFLDEVSLQRAEQAGRLKKPSNPDGLIPGEGSCFTAWRSAPSGGTRASIALLGVGSSVRSTGDPGDDPPGTALTIAMRAAINEARVETSQVRLEITDATGERACFLEHALAVARVFVDPQPRLHVWHQAMMVGSIGASAGACSVGWGALSLLHGHAPGPYVLCTSVADDRLRAAAVLGFLGV